MRVSETIYPLGNIERSELLCGMVAWGMIHKKDLQNTIS
jgi:hypothetical protein